MSKLLRILLITIGALLILGFIGMRVMMDRTKQHSPEEQVSLTADGLEVQVRYCRPYKKGRQIFGGLVPYDQVWRTGANEATTLRTDHELDFGGTRVPAGTYTLWTIPGPDTWKVILNSKRYGWGVSWGGVASREAEHDVASVSAPVESLDAPVEQFTIRFTDEPQALVLEWDRTSVSVPLAR